MLMQPKVKLKRKCSVSPWDEEEGYQINDAPSRFKHFEKQVETSRTHKQQPVSVSADKTKKSVFVRLAREPNKANRKRKQLNQLPVVGVVEPCQTSRKQTINVQDLMLRHRMQPKSEQLTRKQPRRSNFENYVRKSRIKMLIDSALFYQQNLSSFYLPTFNSQKKAQSLTPRPKITPTLSSYLP